MKNLLIWPYMIWIGCSIMFPTIIIGCLAAIADVFTLYKFKLFSKTMTRGVDVLELVLFN